MIAAGTRLGGAIHDAISEVGVAAETSDVSVRGAAKGLCFAQHAGDAELLERSQPIPLD